jgi:hypothetical protein
MRCILVSFVWGVPEGSNDKIHWLMETTLVLPGTFAYVFYNLYIKSIDDFTLMLFALTRLIW